MLNVQKVGRIEFERVMKKRRLRTYSIIGIIIVLFIYLVGVFCYEYGIRRNYSKFLINMDAGNFDIEELKSKVGIYEKDMDIKEIDYDMDSDIENSNSPKSVIIHHTAVNNLTPQSINEDHKNKGYGGIGYHFYIRKDGTIYKGRDEKLVGAHAIGRNYDSIGICLEGNFEKEGMNEEQERALLMLTSDMVIKYNISDIIGHRDTYQTLCPGKNVSIEEIREKVKNEIVEYISKL